MKKLTLLFLSVLFSAISFAQSPTFTLMTPPCDHDGVLVADFTGTGITLPMTVTWYYGAGRYLSHSGITRYTDTLSSYPGGYADAYGFGGGSVGGSYAGVLPFTYTITPTTAICPALSTLNVTVSGGTAPYSYQWLDESSTYAIIGTVNPLTVPAGTYGVTITDAHGCVFGSRDNNDTGTTIYGTAPFTVTLNTTPANCTNGTVTISPLSGGTTPYSYVWSNSATTSSISGLVMGYYSVVVTDASGCSATGYAYVAQSISIFASVNPTPATCTATDGAVIAFGAGGTPPYLYLWSNSATTQSQTGLSPGYYAVTATDVNGCFGSGGNYVGISTPITVSYSVTPSLCTSPTGSATLSIAGGTGPYTTSWVCSPPATGITASGLIAGYYPFYVVDASGCVQSGSVIIPPVDVIVPTFTATPALCTTASGGIAVALSGGTTPYTYSWSTGSTASSISGVVGGTYTVTITDHSGCSITKEPIVPVSSPLSVGLSSVEASCLFTADGSITATAAGGTSPYTYAWSNGGTTSTISSLLTGRYWLSVSDAAGCTIGDIYDDLGYDATTTSCYCTIEGTVYDDANNNCIQDPGEAGIPNIQIYCSGMGYTYTDTGGHYSIKVPSGSYTVSETILAFYPLSSCQLNNIPVTAVASSGCTHTVNFANGIAAIHDTHISTWDYNFPVPGHTYNQAVIISNDGTVTESALLAGYKTDGQLFAPAFVPGGIFAGGSNYYSTAAGFPTIAPGANESFLVTYNVPTGIPVGTSVVFKDSTAYAAPMSNWLTDYSPWNNVNYFTTTVIGPYDPNFKEVSPKGRGASGIIFTSDSVLEYMVHFQNTGTAPAENIVVIDTLDNNLNAASLRPVYMSGKCKVTLNQVGTYNIATFTFPEINLPPVSSEPITSNGMFTYTVHTKPGLAIGSTFQNSASIYFDYNAPIKTNKTLNTLGSAAGVPSVGATQQSFTVYPNPANNTFNAIITSAATATGDLKVCDITGRTLITKTVNTQTGTQTVAVDVNHLAPGTYFVTYSANGATTTQKLVIIK